MDYLENNRQSIHLIPNYRALSLMVTEKKIIVNTNIAIAKYNDFSNISTKYHNLNINTKNTKSYNSRPYQTD